MLPSEAISAGRVPAAFLAPDVADTAMLESLESGGIALNDASGGRLVQTWRAWIDDGATSIKVSPLSGLAVTTLVTGAVNLTAVSLAFDAAMTPTVCYVEDGLAKLRWYDAANSVFVTDSFPGVTSCKVSADDKRRHQEGRSDVIFGYTRAGYLYRRQQRDRYAIERPVGPAGTRRLLRMGMAENRCFQFELVPASA